MSGSHSNGSAKIDNITYSLNSSNRVSKVFVDEDPSNVDLGDLEEWLQKKDTNEILKTVCRTPTHLSFHFNGWKVVNSKQL